MSHVPGPWTVHGDNHTLIGCDDRKMMLAEVLWEHVVTEWGRPLAEAQANARLIAAAPELLEACEAALANLTPLYSADHHVMRLLTAAIAKAEGQV